MTTFNCTSITDVHIDFQSGIMSCTLPTDTLEEVVMANCDWGQAKMVQNKVLSLIQPGPIPNILDLTRLLCKGTWTS